jgi:O-antigen ligase
MLEKFKTVGYANIVNSLKKEKILTTKMQVLLLMPVFLLVLGCALSMSKFLGIAVLLRIFIYWKYKRSCNMVIFKSKLFKQSIFFMSIYLLLLLIPTIIMHGNLGEIGHYFERMLPFFLLLFVADEETDIWSGVWSGTSFSLLIICLGTLPYVFAGQLPLKGTFGWHNTLGGTLALLLPIFYFGLYKGMLKHKTVVLGLMLLATAFVFMVLTQSRGALLAFFTSVVVFLVSILLKRKWTIKRISSYIIIAIVLAGSFVYVTAFMGLNLNRNIAEDGRVALLKSSWHMFIDHPLLGVGVGNWVTEYDNVYGVNNIEKHMDSPHNILLQELNEAGIIGLSGFLALLGFQYYHLLKLARVDINSNITKLQWPFAILLTYVVTLVHGQVDYIFFQRSYQMLYWLFWGICCWDSDRQNLLNKINPH